MDKYNGWSSYATWRINLEIFDGLEVNELFDSQDGLTAHYVEEWARDIIFADVEPGLAYDYADAFLADVNWREILDHLIEAWSDE
jgi:hypothetical protein